MIFITSAWRSDDVKSIRTLSPKLYDKITLVCQASQCDDYQKYKEQVQILVLPKHIKTLEPTREYIWKYCKENNISKFFLMDDDLRFSRRIPGDYKHARVILPEDTVRMFNILYSMLEDYAHVGISEQLGNNRFEKNYRQVTRCVRVLGYNLRLIPFNKLKFGRIVCMSDYDMTLQLLRLGLKNCVLFEYSSEHGGSNHRGGCSTYRTPKVLAESARRLAKFHPGFVSLVEKKTKAAWFKGQVEDNKRLDVRIQWVKSYLSSGKEL